jgi:hypothetical protein
MARVRFIGAETVTVPELGSRSIEPDEVVEVPDDRYEGYVCQPGVWEPVEEPRQQEPAIGASEAVEPAPQPRTKTTAARAPQKEEG